MAAVALVAAALTLPVPGATAEPVRVATTPVALAESGEDAASAEARLGPLRFLGGLELTSPDARFGGWSGLEVTGSRLISVSDRGQWLSATVRFDAQGRLAGLSQAQMFPVLGDERDVLRANSLRDAESIARDGAHLFVAFERRHRIRRYAGVEAAGLILQPLPGLAAAPYNGGIEALTALAPGRLFAVAEELADETGAWRAWIVEDGARQTLTVSGETRFKPVGLATLPSGDLLLLERRFSPLAGFGGRIRRVALADVMPGARVEPAEVARLSPPAIADNYEGIAVAHADGRTLVFVISDDNFSIFQRTLLLAFEWTGD
jgi:hypothetical protein